MHIIELAKEAGFTVTGSRIESPYIGGSDISQRLADFAALVRVEYEKPLKLAKEALDMARKGIPPGSGMYGEALAAIRETLADHVEQSLTMVADHSGDANKMVYSKPSVFDGVCCGCSKKAADGYALYCVECWEKSNGDPFAASGKLITKQDHIANVGKMVAEPVCDHAQQSVTHFSNETWTQQCESCGQLIKSGTYVNINGEITQSVTNVEPEKQGCAYCQSPLFAGTKCNNCGRVTLAEPVKHSEHYWLHEINNARADGYERGYAAGKSEPVKQEPITGERDSFLAGYKAAQDDAKSCCIPPIGLLCTRQAGHDGPCAVIEDKNGRELVSRGMSRLAEPVKQEPVAWKHDCAALLMNGVELWIDQCPHCGKPRHYAPVDMPQAEPTSVDAKAIRAKALEEAKKACDEICKKAIDSGYTVKGKTFIDGFGDGACACATAISGLK